MWNLLGIGCSVATDVIYRQLKFSELHEDMLRMSSRRSSVVWKKDVEVWGCQDKNPNLKTCK